MAKVSVVIPCYNQGAYLDEAVQSALQQSYADLEIIIVNDGSTDAFTIEQCNSYQDPRISTLNTDNQGLAAARNNGIAQATGTYILPLDADDRIAEKYLEDAVAVLDNEPDIGIVYCRARLFGAVETDWLLPDYCLENMLRDNVIFCTALYRKSDWQLVGGYDPAMIYGWEDYDFWLALIGQGRRVHRLDGFYFFYRVSGDSMVRSKEKWQKIEMFKRIYQKHQKLIGEHIEVWLEPLIDCQERYLTCRLYVDCGTGISDASSVVRKIEPGRRTIRFPIDSFEGRRTLRFDPVDCPACLFIETFELVVSGTRVSVNIEKAGSNAAHREQNYFLFNTDDPQIFPEIDPELTGHATEVIIICNLKSIGMAALQEIISYQKVKLASRNKMTSLARWLQPGS
jgi:glycosyltransferase involved in cell wall biosynthesis